MIYEIPSLEVCIAVQTDATFIINSADGAQALVSSPTTPSGITIINTYEDTELTTLMSSLEWIQPCVNCTI